ncbi:uncharacterized protein BJ171DRAFT_508131 [Polychytrium aggregatum]|uniref:uncharacterized protein n=1 Tax=Polychytrium aggregatum TaxID=110093 RepID=UPI0022FEA422|nr:uncharacterized protein BJ171DRAFT_508107 [Polychytrium aggregatum]XP_052965897.1 uncharacterized protein BJ171DRAFT_508131 [Polychytrium aggregatum]KAI9203811.1 hypothetical protein BJ171DRAFT_508107 [Polychytrium aggregatum]KAI9203817.1 hypothetical protein BJ171DRAFT_508131 [Polychytrium aggregatum]
MTTVKIDPTPGSIPIHVVRESSMGPTLVWILCSGVSALVLSVDFGLASGSFFSRILYLSVVIEHPTPSVVITQPKSCFPSFLTPKSLGSSLKLVCQKVSCFVVPLTLVFRSSHLRPVPVWYPRISHSALVSSLMYLALASQSGTKVHCARGTLCRFLVWASRSVNRLIRFVLMVICLHTSSCWVWSASSLSAPMCRPRSPFRTSVSLASLGMIIF